jgi:ADP-ribose pyrophosphatase YjhB (NUDIX family)
MPDRQKSTLHPPTVAEIEQTLMSNAELSRTYPLRPYLAVSAAIFRDGRVLIVRRARPPAHGLYTLPGGGVELGETLEEAVAREVLEETALIVEPVGLAGYRQAIVRDAEGRVERHFVILPFAARWIEGEISLNEELAEAHWLEPAAIAGLQTTDGLAQIVIAAAERIAAGG